MTLRVYLATVNLRVKDFAALLNVTPKYVSLIMNGNIKPGRRLKKDIERITGGKVDLTMEQPKLMRTIKNNENDYES